MLLQWLKEFVISVIPFSLNENYNIRNIERVSMQMLLQYV